MTVAAIVPAAGGSRRLGRPKQLVEIDGRPLVRRTVEMAIEAGLAPIVVVVGCEAEAVGEALAGLDVLCVDHPDWESGMGGSIRAGLAALDPPPQALVVLPCDLPRLDAAILRRLAARADPEALAACRFADTLGPPALFGAAHFEALARLEGDRGAKALLLSAGSRVAAIDWPAGALDLDEPGDI